MSKKVFSLSTIEIIMMWAIFDSGKVTSLEVKNYLRNKGYSAKQADVSKAMAQILEENTVMGAAWDIDNIAVTMEARDVKTNGVAHKEYYFEVIPTFACDTEEGALPEDCLECPDLDNCKAAESNAMDAISDLLDSVAKTVKAPVASAPAKPSLMDPRAYIRANMGTDSRILASDLGISVASVRSYKANITRG